MSMCSLTDITPVGTPFPHVRAVQGLLPSVDPRKWLRRSAPVASGWVAPAGEETVTKVRCTFA